MKACQLGVVLKVFSPCQIIHAPVDSSVVFLRAIILTITLTYQHRLINIQPENDTFTAWAYTLKSCGPTHRPKYLL